MTGRDGEAGFRSDMQVEQLGDARHDDLDADAWKALNLRTRYYTTRLHVGACYLPAFLEEMLREVEEPK